MSVLARPRWLFQALLRLRLRLLLPLLALVLTVLSSAAFAGPKPASGQIVPVGAHIGVVAPQNAILHQGVWQTTVPPPSGGTIQPNTGTGTPTGESTVGNTGENPLGGNTIDLPQGFSPSADGSGSVVGPDGTVYANPKEAQEAYNLGFDPATNKYSPSETAAGLRLQENLGITLTRDPSGAGDWIDSSGNVYDAVGPAPTQYFNATSFNNSIANHLLKSGSTTVVDVTGLTPAQVSSVQAYISSLPSSSQASIIKLGF